MAAVGRKLTGTGNADVNPAVMDGRRTGGHGIFVLIGVHDHRFVDGADLAGLPVDFRVTKLTALGGEKYSVGIRIIGYVGADIPSESGFGIHDLACEPIKDQQGGGILVIAAVPVVGANHHKFVAGVGAGPIKSTCAGVGPGSQLFLRGLGQILIRHRDTGKVRMSRMVVPESGVDVTVLVGNGAVGLSPQGVRVDPQGVQCLGVEGLYFSTSQAHKNHAVRIGRGDNRKAGGANHLTFLKHLSRVQVQFEQLGADVRHQRAIHNDRRPRSCRPAGAVLGCPKEFGILRIIGRRRGGNTEVIVSIAKVSPLCINRLVNGVIFFGLCQFQCDGAGVGGHKIVFLPHITRLGHRIRIGVSRNQTILTLLGPNPCVGCVRQKHQGIRRRYIKIHQSSLLLVYDQSVQGAGIVCRIGNQNFNPVFPFLQ